jgi:hypothetical protein
MLIKTLAKSAIFKSYGFGSGSLCFNMKPVTIYTHLTRGHFPNIPGENNQDAFNTKETYI